MADPDWRGGDYYGHKPPAKGLAVARMVGHITYLSDEAMREKFGRRLRDIDDYTFTFSADFEVESYLRYQGLALHRPLRRQHATCTSRARSTTSTSRGGTKSLADALRCARARFLVMAFRATGCTRRTSSRRSSARSARPTST